MAPEKNSSIRPEIKRPQLPARFSQPVSMPPRPHHQQVRQPRVCLRNGMISAERSRKIFGVKPSADIQHRAVNVVEVLRNVARLPILVVRVMPDALIQQGVPCQCCNGLQSRPMREKELIPVLGSIVEELTDLRRRKLQSTSARLEVIGIYLKLRCQHERAVVVSIVPKKKICHWSLRRGRLDGRMRINNRG